MYTAHSARYHPGSTATFAERVNGSQHELALRLFMAIVLAHWAEHLLQAFQIYVLGWPVPAARGLLGYFYPWLIKSEALHYGYALVMLAGLWLLRPGFTGVHAGLGIDWWRLRRVPCDGEQRLRRCPWPSNGSGCRRATPWPRAWWACQWRCFITRR